MSNLKNDVNGRTIVGGDTVVWETEDGLSYHAGYVNERQDSDPIDVMVTPMGSGGSTYVVIKARRLRLAKQGNEGSHTVADLIDMADALESPLPKPVKIPPLADQGKILRQRYLYAGEQSLASITDPDARIEVMQDRLAIAVDYAATFRSSSEPEQVEACEKAIRFANMWSQAILATAVRRPS